MNAYMRNIYALQLEIGGLIQSNEADTDRIPGDFDARVPPETMSKVENALGSILEEDSRIENLVEAVQMFLAAASIGEKGVFRKGHSEYQAYLKQVAIPRALEALTKEEKDQIRGTIDMLEVNP